MDENKIEENQTKFAVYSQNATQVGFTQIEETLSEYHKNKQILIDELMEGMNEVFAELGKLNEDLGKAVMREEKRKENLMNLRGSCCKITKEFYDTIKFHFNMPTFKKV